MTIKLFKCLFTIFVCAQGHSSPPPIYAAVTSILYPQREIMDIKGRPFDFKNIDGNYRLFLFINPTILNQKNVLYYAQTLHHKYQGNGLKIVCIFPDGALEGRQIAFINRISFPILDDRNNTIHDLYSIKSCCGGTVLINRLNKVIFRDSVLLNDENLRQLIEKTLTGKISYVFETVPPSSFMNVQRLNNLHFLNLKTNQFDIIENISKTRVILTFFSKACSTCGFRNRLKTLSNLAAYVSSDVSMPEIGLVFPDYVDEEDILAVLGNDVGGFSIYLCPDFFPAEHKYITDVSKKTDPFTLYHDRKTGFFFIEPPGMSEEDLEAAIKSAISRDKHE